MATKIPGIMTTEIDNRDIIKIYDKYDCLKYAGSGDSTFGKLLSNAEDTITTVIKCLSILEKMEHSNDNDAIKRGILRIKQRLSVQVFNSSGKNWDTINRLLNES